MCERLARDDARGHTSANYMGGRLCRVNACASFRCRGAEQRVELLFDLIAVPEAD
jgi:hypothetical protein